MTRSRKPAKPPIASNSAPSSGSAVDDANAQTTATPDSTAIDADRAKSLQGLAASVHSAEAFWKAAAKFQRLR